MTTFRFAEESRCGTRVSRSRDAGADKAAPVASMEYVHLVIFHATYKGLVSKQADIKTAFLNSRMPTGVKATHAIPPKGFVCTPRQVKQVWRLKAWLYGLRLWWKGWNGAFDSFLLKISFVQSTADPCLYIRNPCLSCLPETTKNSCRLVSTEIAQMKKRFDTVGLGDAKFTLGMAIQRNLDAGTVLLTREA